MAEDINYEIIEALAQIARERNLKREIVLESLEIGLLTAAKRALGTLDPVEVDVDKDIKGDNASQRTAYILNSIIAETFK